MRKGIYAMYVNESLIKMIDFFCFVFYVAVIYKRNGPRDIFTDFPLQFMKFCS